ncbi:MAG TPA: ABC transporter permease [Bryobacteraceae bacterium]|nr:ABC transporter permease [Bryobacteraceae bacterium]
MAQLLADLRFALRSLRKSPLFTVVAVLSIAFGIAANSAVFTLLDQVVLRALPVTRPAQIVQIHAHGTESYGGGMGDGTELSYAMFKDLRDRNQVFSGMFCQYGASLHIAHTGQSERVNGMLVSGTYFPVLGVTPALGRLFSTVEDKGANAHPVAVLGYDYWKSRFDGDPSVLGRTVIVDARPFEIIGVARRGFQGLDIGYPPQVYLPITMEQQIGPSWLQLEGRRFRWVQVYGRLHDGMTVEHARAGLQPLYHSILETEARDKAFAGASADTKKQFLAGQLQVVSAGRGHSGLRDEVSKALFILMAIAAGVLLIVCSNVANLLIARGAARNRELALRLAIGATRPRLMRLLLVETSVLAAMGMLVGLIAARWGASLLLSIYANRDNAMAITADPDLRIVFFTAALAAVTAVLAGSIPALRGMRVDLATSLRGTGGGVLREEPRLRKTLVVTQVALSFLLLIGAGLFVRSLDNLLGVSPGFRTSHLLSFSLDLSSNGYKPEREHDFALSLQQRVSQLPGVRSTAFAFIGMMEGGGWGMDFTVEGHHPRAGEDVVAMCNAVSPDFFRTMNIPLLAGREFDLRDDRSPKKLENWPYRAAVVNQTFAKKYFGGANPIGRHIGFGSDPNTPTPIEVVGLAKDTLYAAVREEQRPQVFVPYLQSDIDGLTMYIHTGEDAGAIMSRVREAVSGLDPALPVFNVSTMEERIERSTANDRLIAGLSAVLSTMATLLAVIGLYGVMAYTVTRRTREIGIRVALGARGSGIAGRVLREAGLLVAIGLALGGGASIWLGQFVKSQLYGVKPADPETILLAAFSLAVVAGIAAFLPARRAAAISPMTALREE